MEWPSGKMMMLFSKHSRQLLIFVCTIALVGFRTRPCAAASAAEVDAALQKGIDNLYSLQHDGNWEKVAKPIPQSADLTQGTQWGGLTAIATFALLAAEQSPQDSRLIKAVDFLQAAKMSGTYAVAMRAQVWPFVAHQRRVKESALADLKLLLNGARTKGPGRGLWCYQLDDPNQLQTDNSTSQMALLGVWACEETGVEVPTAFWQIEDTVWRQQQLPVGGWPYMFQGQADWGHPFISMTCAGVASLYITQDKLVTVASQCKPVPADPAIQRGITFVSEHIPSDFSTPPEGTWINGGHREMYGLFVLSRLGLASGLRYVGDHDWFREGSDYLVKTQHPDGSWGESWETAFVVLFLSRGRAPVAFNKLEYDSVGKPPLQTWNVRPRDMANLTEWIGKELERRINWQVVEIKSAPDDWLDAPILYISGSDELNLSPDQIEKLHRFVESGGMILGNADCNNAKFSLSFQKLGKQMFPNYEFVELPADHSIYTNEQFSRTKWKVKPQVLAMSNGVRQLMVFCPDADLGRIFQTRGDRSRPEEYQLAVDLYQYMVGLVPPRKGESCIVTRDPSIKATGTMKVARLSYAGNWDPEPAGWRRMGNVLHNKDKLDISVEAVDLSTKLSGFELAHLTGTAPLKLDTAQQSALVDYVNGGGTLLVDSAGGNSEFAISMEQQLNALFSQPLEILPPESELYRSGKTPMTSFNYSRFSKSVLGNLNSPRIKGIKIDGRLAVLFSPDDLSLGMIGQPVDGVIGYTPDTATEIVRRITLFTAGDQVPLSQDKPATASSVYGAGYGPEMAVDGKDDTRWATTAAVSSGWLQIDLGGQMKIGRTIIKEIEYARTQEFAIEYKVHDADAWKECAHGTTIGSMKAIDFPAVPARYVRLNILKAASGPTINEFQIFRPASTAAKK